MDDSLDNEGLAKRLLLGRVSDAERAQIEDRFLADDEFYQELLATEDELIDSYVRGELPAHEHELVEHSYLASPLGREQIDFARRFSDTISRTAGSRVGARQPRHRVSWRHSLFGVPVVRRAAFGLSALVVLLAVVLGGWWLFGEKKRSSPAREEAQTRSSEPPAPSVPSTPPQIAEPAAAGQNAAPEISPPPIRETPKRTAPVVATVTLLPGMVRGDAGNHLVLPENVTTVRLRLSIEGVDYRKYRAVLSTPEGGKAWEHDFAAGPSLKSARLMLNVPATLLKSGDYLLEINGANADGRWENAAYYSFRVARR